MDLQMKSRHTELHDQVRDYIQKKFRWVDRYAPRVRTVEVEVSREQTKAAEQRMVVQVTINLNGTLIRAQERATDVYTAIDMTKDVLQRQLERYQARAYLEKRRKAAAASARLEESPEELSAAPEAAVVRVKSFALKPMPPEEAVEQMELLGHDFFFFYNSDANQYNVVYRRKAGGYGLLQPS